MKERRDTRPDSAEDRADSEADLRETPNPARKEAASEEGETAQDSPARKQDRHAVVPALRQATKEPKDTRHDSAEDRADSETGLRETPNSARKEAALEEEETAQDSPARKQDRHAVVPASRQATKELKDTRPVSAEDRADSEADLRETLNSARKEATLEEGETAQDSPARKQGRRAVVPVSAESPADSTEILREARERKEALNGTLPRNKILAAARRRPSGSLPTNRPKRCRKSWRTAVLAPVEK